MQLREYQANIVNNILKYGSSLVVLPTGLGKTYIAIAVIEKIFQKKQNAKILFLAPTKPLVEQHSKTLKEFFKDIIIITGEIKQNKRLELIKKHQIIVATPQTIANDLGKIFNEFFDLIIFDEAHRATGNYAYVKIAKYFEKSLNIGLTASPGNTKAKVKEIMKNLKLTNLELKTEESPDVLPYIKKINIFWIKVDLPLPLKEINNLLKTFLKQYAQKLRKMGFALRSNFTQKDLIAIQKRIINNLNDPNTPKEMYHALSIIAALMKIEHAITLLETQGINALKEYMERLLEEDKTKASKLLKQDENIQKAKYIIDSLNILDLEHPKIKKLQEIILKELDKNPNQKIIVFNHYRDSVATLETILNKNPLIKAKKFVGQSNKSGNKGLSQKEQKALIEEFRENKFNVLLATSIAEEGLDIPKVDTVIFYEPIPSDIRTIQRRGRTGRLSDGKVYILITKDTRDEAFYWAAKNKEKNMKKTLLSLTKKEQDIDQILKKEPKQKLLTEIITFEKEKEKITIFADTREQKSKTFKELKKKDAEIKIKQLDIGDYQVGPETIIERKTANDFINSIIDARLFQQALKLSAYEKPIIIIENDLDYELETRELNKNQIYGAIFSLLLEFKIPIIFAKNHEDTANLIYLLAKREQQKNIKLINLRKIKKNVDEKLLQRYIIEGLPHVGPKLAIRLLEKFNTIKSIINAPLDKLKKIEGIGNKKAEDIYKIINKKYRDGNDNSKTKTQ